MNNDLYKLSLNQGKQFNNYQTKIKKNGGKPRYGIKEGFTTEGFTTQSQTNSSSKATQDNTATQDNNVTQANLDELKRLQMKYNILTKKHNAIQTSINNKSMKNINRVSSSNPYLNKNIYFTDGTICYVTNQGIVKPYMDLETYNEIAGKNGCPPKEYISLNIPWSSDYIKGAVIPTEPPLIVGTPMVIGQSCGNEGNNVYVDKYLSNSVEPSYVGCFNTSEQNDNMTFLGSKPDTTSGSGSGSTLGTYTYADCKEEAISKGYQYFALQNVDYASAKGYCAVSNDLTKINGYGESLVPSKTIKLWSSNTAEQPGNTCMLTNTGSLAVVDTSGKTIYATPSSTTTDSGYLGCYADKSSRAMTNTSSGAYYPLEKCKELAKEKGFKYYAGQNAQKDSSVWCAGSNDLSVATKYGLATNCIDKDGTILGGGWSNSIYSMEPGSNYYLILGDDGNMCIHRGTDPNNDQGQIWCSETKGQQQNANPSMVSSKGKYGKNWIKNDSVLASGDFVSSTKGDLVLQMEDSGDLVLYTFTMESNCKAMSDGNVGGGFNANATYNIHQQSFPQNIGLYGYVDDDSILKQYPESMVGFTNDYQIHLNSDLPGNDITSLTVNDETGCQTECNNNESCAAYVYQVSTNTCWIKNKAPPTKPNPNDGTTLGLRKPKLQGTSSCGSKLSNIDSVQYNNYIKGDLMTQDSICNAKMVSEEDKMKLDNVKQELYVLGETIALKMETLYKENANIIKSLNTNDAQFKKDLEKYRETSSKIKQESILQSNGSVEGMQNQNQRLNMSDINGMLLDSDLKVLQENSRYILWGILAVGLLTVTLRTMSK